MENKEIDNGIKLFEYLEKLSLLNINIRNNIKKLSNEESIFDLENEEFLPVIKNVYLKNKSEEKVGEVDSNEIFLSIERYKIENPPMLPKELNDWIDYDLIDFVKPNPKEFIIITEKFEDDKEREKAFKEIHENKNNPILLDWIKKDASGGFVKIEELTRKIFFKDIFGLEKIYNNWIELKWEPWKEKNYQYYLVNQAYDRFFSLRSFLKTESDNYDLLWGHDILSWKNGNSEIYYPTFFTPVNIELDAEKNIIFIKKDINVKSFFDISFIREGLSDEASRNLIDIDSLAERINLRISDGDFNIWDYELVHKYFQELAHYISPDGESRYYDRKEDIEFKKNPIFFNHHNLFLLKKSGKSWADYAKKIQEDIKKNNSLTPFLEDLVCEQTSSKTDNKKEGGDIDGELYFSLPYNEEQKKIANRIDADYGAVVQGPPGTGKTHTIANLISRFLALGKNVLVTSQTGQALSVVKNKLPKNIRNIAVSQVESSNKGDDLQSSVLEINTILSENTKFTEKKLDQAKNDLRYVREKIVIKNNEFSKKSLLDSNEEIIIGVEKISPINAAKFISSFQDSAEFKILDDVDYRKELTVTQKQIDNYISTLSCVENDVWDFAKMDRIPLIEELPSLNLLEKYFKLKKDLSDEEISLVEYYIPTNEELCIIDGVVKKIKDFEKYKKDFLELEKNLKEKEFFIKNDIAQKEFFSLDKEDLISNISNDLKEILKILKSFNEPWEDELFKSIKNLNEKKRWEKFYVEFDKLAKEYRRSDEILIGMKISFKKNYNIDYLKSIEIISKILKNPNGDKIKKGMGLLFDLNVRNFIKNVNINDKEIDTVENVKILNAYFLKLKIEDDLKNIWEQAFSSMSNIKPFLSPFNIIEFEGFLDTVNRLIYFEKNNDEVKNELCNLKLFDELDITNIKFIEESIIIFDKFSSYFKMNKIDKYINQTVLSFQKENIHKDVHLLLDYIRQKDVKNILSLRKKIIELNERKDLSLEYSEIKKNIFNEKVIQLKSNPNNHKDVLNYFNNIELCNIKEVTSFYKKIPELIDKQNKSKEIKEIEDLLGMILSKTINKIKSSLKNNEDVFLDIEKNWKWKRLVNWLDSLHLGDSVSKISKDLEILKKQEMNLMKDVVEISACLHLKKKVTKKQKEALASFALSMKKYGKGTGKYASKHLSDARKALEYGKGAVPVWIMPINTIHQLFPNPTAGMFDLVIFDEASQVDTRGLNVAYIGKKLLVVGDDEQVSPTSFTTQSKVTDLITRYIYNVPNSCHFSNTSSLFDIAKIKMTDIITLTEHFRSIEEIIGFSNLLSYDGKLKVLRDQLPKYRLNPVLETVFVDNGFEDTNMKVNRPEAEKVIEKLKEILCDKNYEETNEDGESRPLTIGVISLLGKDQSKYLTDLVSKNISSKEIEKRKIVCGDPYVFQGDERDIMLISMVKSLDLHNPELNIMPYSISKKEYKQRINVAMSRAKNKMILFHSIPREKISNKDDLRKKILDWFYNHKTEEKIFGLQRVREEVERGRASEFEYEVAKLVITKGYKVIPQYEVAGYRIDLVVQGEDAKLAIECDGDQYHNRIEKWEEDMERQQILERAGWNFWRLTGSSFYKNREEALVSLWEKLKEMGIHPIS